MKFRDSKEFHTAAARLLEMVERQERGEISEMTLLNEWQQFMRAGQAYLDDLKLQIKLN